MWQFLDNRNTGNTVSFKEVLQVLKGMLSWFWNTSHLWVGISYLLQKCSLQKYFNATHFLQKNRYSVKRILCCFWSRDDLYQYCRQVCKVKRHFPEAYNRRTLLWTTMKRYEEKQKYTFLNYTIIWTISKEWWICDHTEFLGHHDIHFTAPRFFILNTFQR